ncbi:hypothetical protein [Nocardioides sp. cx-173]|uniref:hypothetical protein n=1 Tax=Nocardioides sp. cx-173 TaxID=2898796 RepID=UPI001E4F6A76|nr:hypothetical protein [Nocardioides sp. cx-173]MCD4525529.1 hypothetical protein [Nocardioides sp. cx-173]UGB42673.1 hypothetical protein LQ940_03900 [Nocardioides sp. cx-173]
MTPDTNDYQPSLGLGYLLGGLAVLIVAGMCLVNADGDHAYAVVGLVLLGTAGYLLLVGGVARGLQVARTSDRGPVIPPRDRSR